MSPEEVKGWVDILNTLLASGSIGGIILAILGYMRAKAEKPHIADKPSVGSAGLAQIGGMVMGQNDLKEIIEALRSVAAAHDRCTLAREADVASRKREAEEHREHERRLLAERREYEGRLHDDRHREHQQFVEVIKDLIRGIRDMRCAN